MEHFIQRWTTWELSEDGSHNVLQCTLTLLDAATWEPVREITLQCDANHPYGAVRRVIWNRMEEWVMIHGYQLELDVN